MSLVNTLMVNMRVPSQLDKWEIRPSQYGALDLFARETDNGDGIISNDLVNQAFRSIGRTLQVPVIDYDGSITIGNTRSVTIADDENTSQLVTISFTTYAFGFTMTPAAFMNNDIDYQTDFDKKLMSRILKFAATLDSAAIAALETAKSRVFGSLLGKYTNASNVVAATLANKLRIPGDLTPIMHANDFYGPYHLLGNPGLQSIAMELRENGLYNAENRVIQLDDKELHFSNRLTDAANKIATGFMVNGGSVGMLTRVERDALMGTTSRTGHEWDVVNLPVLNMPVGSYYYESVGDYNAITGAATADLTRTKKEHFDFSVDVAFVTAYNSDRDTYASPIVKFDVADS